MQLRNPNKPHNGFTLIELAVVMGVIGVVTAGLWKLSGVSNLQNKDQATAQQQQALIAAVKAFLADTTTTGGNTWLLTMTAGSTTATTLPLPTTTPCASSLGTFTYTAICNYLPSGFTSSTTNAYGQTYAIKVLPGATTSNQGYSFMIMTSGGTTISDADGGRVAGLIGGDGGFIYTNNTCTTSSPATTACGALGAWSTLTSKYSFTGVSGTIASQTFVSSQSSLGFTWLARVHLGGDNSVPPTNNTMTVDEYMGVGTASGTIVTGANIDFPGSTTAPIGSSPLSASSVVPSGDTLVSGAIHLGNAYIDGSGTNSTSQAQITLYNPNGNLIALTSGCSVIDIPNNASNAEPAGCNPAITINHGDIEITSGQSFETQVMSGSDIRFKKDIHPLKNSLDIVMKIDPVTFTYRASGRHGMGVIAQELEKIYPQLVTEDFRGMKYVAYDGLIGPLLESVQELKRQNDDLRAQLAAQAARIEKIESQITSP